MYVCPICKEPLTQYFCSSCATQYTLERGIPCFIPDVGVVGSSDVRQIYDSIYHSHHDAWQSQGRDARFRAFVSDLVGSHSNDRVLEIGCGEGALLSTVVAREKYGIDPSMTALIRAKSRASAEYAVARAEQLPFPENSFDVVLAVGVMEDFTQPSLANAEIRRVLAPSGCYITVIHADMSFAARIFVKLRQYIYPHFAPLALAKWLGKRLRSPIVQPFRKSYTLETATSCLEQAGLTVVQVITTATHPAAPLAGSHVLILLARLQQK